VLPRPPCCHLSPHVDALVNPLLDALGSSRILRSTSLQLEWHRDSTGISAVEMQLVGALDYAQRSTADLDGQEL
jgi:hypothetical protein